MVYLKTIKQQAICKPKRFSDRTICKGHEYVISDHAKTLFGCKNEKAGLKIRLGEALHEKMVVNCKVSATNISLGLFLLICPI